MTIPNRDINIGRQGMLYDEDPLAIVNTPAVNTESAAQQTQQEFNPANINLAGTDWASQLTGNIGTFEQNFYDTYMNQVVDPDFGTTRAEAWDSDPITGTGDLPTDYNSLINIAGNTFDEGTTPSMDRINIISNALGELGLEYKYQGDGGSYYFNPETMSYDFRKDSLLDKAEPVVKAVALTALTGGIGGQIAGGLGLSGSAIGTGVTNAVVNAGLQQAITGDVDLIQAATAGFNAGLNSYADATKAATEAASVVGATAEMADTARNMQSTLEVLETVKDTINLAEAIDDKNVLGAIDISLGMADLPNTKTFVADKLQEAFPDSDIVTRHADSLASATIKTGVKLAEGESVGDAVKSGLLEYVKQGGGLGIDMPDINFEIDFGIGESDMLERIDQWVRDLPTTKEDWERWEDNVKNSADAVVRALPTTKEDWQNLEQVIKDGAEVVKTTVVDPVVSVVRETGRAIEEGYDTVEDFVKEDVVPVLDPIYETLRDAEEAGERFVQGLGDNLPELPDAEGVDMPDINRPSFSTPNIDLDLLGSSEGGLLSQDELAKMRMGDQYVFDLNLYSNLRNPLLNS
jgi:hypothetical protein